MNSSKPIPSIPQLLDADQRQARKFQCELARTAYNYTVSYLESIPLSADVPPSERFNPEYLHDFGDVVKSVAENYVASMKLLIGKELGDDGKALVESSIEAMLESNKARTDDSKVDTLRSIADLAKAIDALIRIPEDVASVVAGIEQSFRNAEHQGPTALLEYPLRDTLTQSSRFMLQATSSEDFAKLFQTLPLPLCLTVKAEPWMQLASGQMPWEQDWYFGYQQIAGYNTTQLQGVKLAADAERGGVLLEDVLAKMPITDAMFGASIGETGMTLAQAAAARRLYVVDYSMLEGLAPGKLFGRQRYVAAPIALFYWNPTPPPGYPPLSPSNQGAMQPVAIQLGQHHDPESTPIFTPTDANKWSVAKYFVQSACGIEHEVVAHLTKTHLVIDPMIVASHRRLPETHPILVLLLPHFQFTIAINAAAMDSLIVPGGTLPAVLSVDWQSSMDLIREAIEAWRFDEQQPVELFDRRGVGARDLPQFPFREDTLPIWQALLSFVSEYVALYYASDDDVQSDYELQAWVNELVATNCAAIEGMNGLVDVGSSESPRYELRSREYLTHIVAMMIYIAGPLHASVNYAQYPMMSFIPSVSGTAYRAPPTRSSADLSPVEWMPPLDLALYQLSFLYILSAIQYNTFGVYTPNPRKPYFTDPRAQLLAQNFRYQLAVIEEQIHQRNIHRPYPYRMQVPSLMPNSISS